MSDDIDSVLSALTASRRVLLTTHVRPDGDALGSVAAMALALRRKNIPHHVLLLSRLPKKYTFIFQENDITFQAAEPEWPADLSLVQFDTLLVLDTGTWSQLPYLKERVQDWPGKKIVVDHHLTREHWPDVSLLRTNAAAAGEIVADLLDRWEIPLETPIATALFLAITSDTGWFQYSNTAPRTLRLAARLMEAGVDTDRIYQMLFQNESPIRLAIQTRAQQNLELLADSKLAVMRLRKSDFDELRADVHDTENLVNIPLQVRTVAVSILAVEPKDGGPIRFSFRSKGEVDVARFAEQFGGGGHARAAGLKLAEPFDHACERVIAGMSAVLAGNK